MQKLPLSVPLISFNEEENLSKTLGAIVDIASEIVMVDSGSTDSTIKIAKSFGAKIFIEEWKGYVEQKNSALSKCTQEWILALDCDEVVTPELRRSIVEVIQNNERYAYLLDRVTFYLGKKMKYSWRPDWKLRLVRRDCNPRWGGIAPHDKLFVDCTTKKLKGELFHFSYQNLKDHFYKTVNYSQISAESYKMLQRKFRFYNLLLNPAFAFIKLYFLNFGFLDGYRGLIAGVSSALSSFLKYSFLWELHFNEKHNEKLK
ncbi:MAG: glycosyltransferase family 2 protein [Candidatus Kapaibacteriales bacterium]